MKDSFIRRKTWQAFRPTKDVPTDNELCWVNGKEGSTIFIMEFERHAVRECSSIIFYQFSPICEPSPQHKHNCVLDSRFYSIFVTLLQGFIQKTIYVISRDISFQTLKTKK